MDRPHRTSARASLLLCALLTLGCDPEGSPVELDTDAWLDRLARSHYAGESGQFFVVQEDEATFAHGRQRKIRYHATPFRYDTHVPLVVYSPSAIAGRPRLVHDPVSPINLSATCFDILSVPRTEWVTSKALPIEFSGRPKILALLILDMLSYEAYRDRLGAHPTFSMLEREGIVFDQCDLDYLTTHTSISHAVLGTGTYPNVNGISTNFRLASRDPRVWKWSNYFEEGDPSRLLQPTFADLHDAAVDNRAIVIGFSEHKKAIVPLTGHGTMHESGDRDLVLFQDLNTGALMSGPDQRGVPDYLKRYSPQRFVSHLPQSGIEVTGWAPRSYQELKAHPLCVDYRKQIIFDMLRTEAPGGDDITDLVLINMKILDEIGHFVGTETEAHRRAMKKLDQFTGELIDILGELTGEDYLLILTSDHGAGPLIGLDHPKRLRVERLLEALNRRYPVRGETSDDSGRAIFQAFRHGYLWVDDELIDAAGYDRNEMKRFMLSYPTVVAAFTEEEIRARQQELFPELDPESLPSVYAGASADGVNRDARDGAEKVREATSP